MERNCNFSTREKGGLRTFPCREILNAVLSLVYSLIVLHACGELKDFFSCLLLGVSLIITPNGTQCVFEI